AAGKNAAARDGMPIDCRHYRFRVKEDGLEQPVQGREELADIVRAAVTQPLQIDARGKYLPLSGDHHRLRARLAQIGEQIGHCIAELDVERIGFAMHHRQNGYTVYDIAFDHALCSAGRACAAREIARCDNRSACTTAMVKTTIASI